MTPLQKNALGTTVMSIETVEAINNVNSDWHPKAIRRLCLSHERLRAELAGAEVMLAELAEVEQALRETIEGRCYPCGWKFDEREHGCKPGDCCFRPGDQNPDSERWRKRQKLICRIMAIAPANKRKDGE